MLNSKRFGKLTLFFLPLCFLSYSNANSQDIHKYLHAMSTLKTFSFANSQPNLTAVKGFQKGDKFEIVTIFNTVEQEEDWIKLGWSVKLSGTITSQWEVTNVNPSTISFEHSIKKIKTEMSVPLANPIPFDSEKEEDFKNKDNRVVAEALKNIYSINLDANGVIKNVLKDKLNPNTGIDSVTEYQSGAMLMLDEGNLPDIGNVFSLKIALPKNPAVNNNWISTVSKDDEKRTTSYTIKQISDADVTLDYKIEDSTLIVIKKDEKVNKLTVKCLTNGTVTIDKKTEIIKQYNAEALTTFHIEIIDSKTSNIITDTDILKIKDNATVTVKTLK